MKKFPIPSYDNSSIQSPQPKKKTIDMTVDFYGKKQLKAQIFSPNTEMTMSPRILSDMKNPV